MRFNRKVLSVSIFTASFCLGSSVYAAGIEEIVVTAQKREQSANDIPIAISAFGGDQLSDLGITDTRDLEKAVPGFTVGESGFGTPIYTLRGVGFNDRTLWAQPNVSVYTDEFNLPYSLMTKGPIFDMQRVEVLKGPQGILYGRNTTGGAINYITNKPSEEFEAGVKLGYGKYETVDVEGFVSGALSDNVTGRLALRSITSGEGNQESITRSDKLGKKDIQAIRGQLDWQASDDLLLRFTVSGWEDQSEPRAAQAIAIVPQVAANLPYTPHGSYPAVGVDYDDPNKADWGAPGSALPVGLSTNWQNNDSLWMTGLRAEWDINDEVQLTALASYMKFEQDDSTQPSSGLNYQHNDQEVTSEVETVAFELRLSGEIGADDQIEWMVGGNYSEDEGEELRTQRLGANTSLVDTFTLGTTGTFNQFSDRNPGLFTADIEQYGIFANVAWHFHDDMTLTVGTRYTEQEQDFTACGYDADSDAGANTNGLSLAGFFGVALGDCQAFGANGIPGQFDGNLEEDNVSYRVALDWNVTDNSLLYISYARGFKSGGFPSTQAANQIQYSPINQEELNAWEIGSKSFFADRQVQLNVALYDYDYTDKQLFTKILDPVFGPLGIIDNAPKASVQGVEVDVQYAPDWLPGLLLAASGAYTDTEVDEFVGLNNNGVPTDFSGRPFNFSPEFQYTLFFRYEQEISESLYGFISADYSYSDDTNASLEGDPLYYMDSYGLVGARLGVSSADDQWSLMLWGKNLTDDYKATGVLSNGDVLARWSAEGRTYGITFEYSF